MSYSDKIAVLIPSFKPGPYVVNCIESVEAQDLKNLVSKSTLPLMALGNLTREH